MLMCSWAYQQIGTATELSAKVEMEKEEEAELCMHG